MKRRQVLCGAVFWMIFQYYAEAQSRVAFTLAEKDLIPEGITFDPAEKTFFISSIAQNKIVAVKNRQAEDFINSNQDGFTGGVGLKVDRSRHILWACSGNLRGNVYNTGIFAWDIKSRHLLKKFVLPEDTVATFFNDLVISRSGEVYITNTVEGCIYYWHLQADRPVKLELEKPLKYPNGLVLLPDQQHLIVATEEGLIKVKLTDGSITPLAVPGNAIIKGLDGLEYYHQAIYGVYNGTILADHFAVIKYDLDKTQTRITNVDTIDVRNPYFDVPTTATVAGRRLYVLANSQIDNFDQSNLRILNPTALKEVIVLCYRLK